MCKSKECKVVPRSCLSRHQTCAGSRPGEPGEITERKGEVDVRHCTHGKTPQRELSQHHTFTAAADMQFQSITFN